MTKKGFQMSTRFGLNALCIGAIILAASLVAGCATTATTTVTRKPIDPLMAQLYEIGLNENRTIRIAVANFDGASTAASLRAGVESALTSATGPAGQPVFTVVEVQNQAQIERQLGRQLSGLTDPSTAVELGRLINAEALVYANVGAYGVRSENTTQIRNRCVSRDAENNCTQRQQYRVLCTERTAEVALTARVVSLRTGRILMSKPFSDDKRATQCEDAGARAGSGVGTAEDLLNTVAGGLQLFSGTRSDADLLRGPYNNVMSELMKHAAPWKQQIRVAFKVDGANLTPDQKMRMEGAIKFIQEGQVDVGCERIFALANRARDFDLQYNVGVCHQLNGNLEDALSVMDALQRALPAPDRDVSNRIEELRELLKESDTGGSA